MTTAPRASEVWQLAGLLRESGDVVLSGCSTLSLLTATLQQLNRVFELYLGPWGPGQTGFVALPSHPADSPTVLQLQFLFDVLQKTLSLKLVHIPGTGLPGPIKIFPFKSLRQLELRGVPLHCLHGLRGIYSQLETLICSRSIQALEELLSACGGDLCSALPWLALLSADFSYNALSALDSSLRLLSALRFLNLSHNRVQDCRGFLMDLSELYHLDVSYNHLRAVPRVGPSGAALGVLSLRGNELRSLRGLEHLRHLRHLDVAYNLLEGHKELAPLWPLAELRKLYLEGNPLWFHPAHRAATAQYLAPQARDAASGFLLDDEVLSQKDFQNPAPPGLGPSVPPVPWPVRSATETSGGPELSDSLSSGGAVAQAPLRKVKGRVRVRRASISEPSDTDPEPRALDPSPAGQFAQQQQELELLSSFRERFGCDWLQYRGLLQPPGSPQAPALSTALHAASPEPPPGPPAAGRDATGPQGPPDEVAEEGRLQPEPQEEEEREEPEEDGRAREAPEEDGGAGEEPEEDGRAGEAPEEDGRAGEEPEEQEWREAEVELCRPMLVCPLRGPEGVRARECFLRVTSAHLCEVELRAARTLQRLELQSLVVAELEPEPEPEPEPGARREPAEGPDLPSGPVLLLRFSYVCPDRRLRRYVVLEPDAPAAVQELLAVLAPFALAARRQRGGPGVPLGARLQCLRCGCEFRPEEPSLGLDGSPAVCPGCGSDHVVLLAPREGAPGGGQSQGELWPAPPRPPSPVCDLPDGCEPRAPGARGRSSWSLGPSPEHGGLRAVDHRLRLFLDVEVFSEAEEEFQCCLKTPVVLPGQAGEFLCLVVVSDHRLYLLRVSGEISGPPAGWLQPTLAIPLQDLSGVELGLSGQSLRLEWPAGAGSCVLLPRDARHCRAFLAELLGVLRSLPPTRRNCISATEEEVTPQHRLWPLLGQDAAVEAPQFFYLRAFLVEGPSARPVSLLLTLATLYLLDEDAAGPQAEPALPAAAAGSPEKAPPAGTTASLHVREQQPLSSLSAVLLSRAAPEDLRLAFYEEVSRLESFWALRVVCREQLTALLAWIREPWEELFSIELRTVTQEALGLDP